VTSIGIFDSGVGGLSVAAETAALLPGHAIDYVCDDAFFPYGTRPEHELIDRVEAVASAFVEQVQPSVLVLACNTASTVALPRLRERLALPIVGVVPAIKPAAALSSRRVIGLLGTEATARRRYTQDLIDRFAADCMVIRVGSAELVRLAETHADGAAPPASRIQAILAPFFERPMAEQPDVIVLACTHFPLLRDALQAACPGGVRLIDSGRAIADRVRNLAPPSDAMPHRHVHFTGKGAGRAIFEGRGFSVAPQREIASLRRNLSSI